MSDYKYSCDDCGTEWFASDYSEDGDNGYYNQGLKCPFCKKGNIGGEEVK